MIIEHVEAYLTAQAKQENRKKRNPFRGSAAGYCERSLGYDKLGIHGRALLPRRYMVLQHGTGLHKQLTQLFAKALGHRFVPEKKLVGNHKLYTEIEGVKISYHPDGGYQTDDNRLAIVEFKGLSDYGFEKATQGEIDREYLCQAWVYFIGTDFDVIVFIIYRKETSHMVEIVFDRHATEKVVTQRMGGDPLQLATSDPLQVTQIVTPFDPTVEEEVRGKYRRLKELEHEKDLVPGVRVIENEVVKVQGREKALEYQKGYGDPVKIAGSWYTFETGRKIAGYPCSYCAKVEICLGAKLEISNQKPLWIIEGAVRR